MEGMDGNSGMGDMPGMASPPPTNGDGMHHHMTMMHMTFFWGKNAEILFSGWPGDSAGMYVLTLFFIFILAVLVEFLSHSKLIKSKTNNVTVGIIQTVMHAVRVGLAYLVMLAIMSFNAGVFIVAVAGHSLGFLLFGSRVFKKDETSPYEKNSDLPPATC